MLTPIEIHNKEFSTKFKGYDPEEVNDYLDEVIRTNLLLYIRILEFLIQFKKHLINQLLLRRKQLIA